MNIFQVALIFVLLLLQSANANNSTSPVWVESTYFKAGIVVFIFTSPSSTSQNMTVTYNSAMTNSNLKVPTLGIIDLGYTIHSSTIFLCLQIVQYASTYLIFSCQVNQNSYLTSLQLRYMALDNSFTPAFSMNYFFPYINQNGSIGVQYFVNFTASTGVTLNTSHQNVLLPFLHFIYLVSYDNTVDIDLNFTLVNQSYYTVVITSTSNMYLEYAGFSRLIFDKTAIEAMGNDYFNYGIVESLNNNASSLSTTIPPDIISDNLYYGLHSFTIGPLSTLSFTSIYGVTSGSLSYSPSGTFTYSSFRFSYMHHKTRTCPSGYPYYNISEMLCYNQCNVGWYGDSSTMACQPCLYDCYTCTNSSGCETCNQTADNRQISSSDRCTPMPGYYDTGVSQAAPCTSSCATCVTSASNCLSCISGYYLSGSSCLSCAAAIPSCQKCTNSSFCTLCNDGLNGTSCTVCNSSQYLKNNNCYSCSSAISNCQTCTSSSSCTLCQSSFTLYSSTNCSCTPTQYDNSGTCLSCSSAISNCTACTSANSCTQCATSFVLVSSTSCTCNSSSYLNSGSCTLCSMGIAYCKTCSNTPICESCQSNFTLYNNTCSCPAYYYADSTSQACLLCSKVLSSCVDCSSNLTCTTCVTGYSVNATTGQCFFQPCQISSCQTCNTQNYSICLTCNCGYSLNPTNTSCEVICGDGQLYTEIQQCDDGNSVNGDGCSSTCKTESGFSCIPQYVSASCSYTLCYYSGTINLNLVWIEKVEGMNALLFSFQIPQNINQWSTVNFSTILEIQNIDPNTNFSTGLADEMISSFHTDYTAYNSRLLVTLYYQNYDLQDEYFCFQLDPYSNRAYTAFTPPPNVQFFPPNIESILQVLANNNQNANLYTEAQYNLYTFSLYATYATLAIALFTIATSLIARAGKVITFEMIIITQITYFSLAFLDYMNPIFAGLLPLRFLAGILTFQDQTIYLEETTAPDSMKGIYMSLSLSNNFSYVASAIALFLALGVLLLLAHFIVDWAANPSELRHDTLKPHLRKGYWLHQLAFHFLGELSISLLDAVLPLFTISVFYQALYMKGSGSFWSYSEIVGVSLVVVAYFIALIKQDYPKKGEQSRLGEYLSEFTSFSIFKTFKFHNLQMIIRAVYSALIMLTIYSDNKLFSAFCIVFVSFLEIVLIVITRPYKYGFVSCMRGDDTSESIFQKIELYKVYDKAPPLVLPDATASQKSDYSQNRSELFVQHFDRTKNKIKTKSQGLIQQGEVLNHSKLYLFNNNFRNIFNLVTIIVVQFVFISTKLVEESIDVGYTSLNVKMFLPFMIHFILFCNVLYNYGMLILQILDRTREKTGKVDNLDNDNTNQFLRSIYTTKKDVNKKEEAKEDSNQQMIKTTTNSMYTTKRPKLMTEPFRTNIQIRRDRKTNPPPLQDIQE